MARRRDVSCSASARGAGAGAGVCPATASLSPWSVRGSVDSGHVLAPKVSNLVTTAARPGRGEATCFGQVNGTAIRLYMGPLGRA